ncbi:MAG: Rpn family recombination-promoting nuclease/putative transposase [Desulfurispora sp.]|uniref:Rpn family recombination-promoting nuclease/putative transposase n=1 Tax=Desulfurispora sp. TaxID=3014275 RepID=UPI00404A510E
MITLDIWQRWQNCLDPKSDIIFKLLFRDEELLCELLNDILQLSGDHRLSHVQVLRADKEKEHPVDKGIILDIHATTVNNDRFNIEMQLRDEHNMANRSIYYNAHILTETLTAGVDYADLSRAVTIIITNYNQFPTSPHYRHHFHWWEDRQKILLTERAEIVFLDLVRVRESFKRGEISRDRDRVIKWMLFLLARDDQNIAQEVEKIMEQDAMIQKARAMLDRISSDPAVRAEYLSRYKYEMDQASRLARARKEGKQEGKQEGLLEGSVKKAQDYICKYLSRKFGASSSRLQQKVREISSLKQLDELTDELFVASSLEEATAIINDRTNKMLL